MTHELLPGIGPESPLVDIAVGAKALGDVDGGVRREAIGPLHRTYMGAEVDKWL